jgi:hypothetical protein
MYLELTVHCRPFVSDKENKCINLIRKITVSLKCYINRKTQPYRSNILVFIQHYYVFWLSTSAIIR